MVTVSEPYLHALVEEFMDGETQFSWRELSRMPLEARAVRIEAQYGEPAVIVHVRFDRLPDQSIDVEVAAADAADPSKQVVLKTNVSP